VLVCLCLAKEDTLGRASVSSGSSETLLGSDQLIAQPDSSRDLGGFELKLALFFSQKLANFSGYQY
jgi:hypothetical protein